MVGDCYEANVNQMYKDKKIFAKAKLVHGVVINQIDNKPMGHCWIELGDVVFDYSNKKSISVRKEHYYKLGKIPVKKYKYHRYSFIDMCKQIVKQETYGPWKKTGCKR